MHCSGGSERQFCSRDEIAPYESRAILVLSHSHGRTLDRCRDGEVAGKGRTGLLFSIRGWATHLAFKFDRAVFSESDRWSGRPVQWRLASLGQREIDRSSCIHAFMEYSECAHLGLYKRASGLFP